MTATEIVPDETALRVERRQRVLAEMEAADLDILILGREGNARYVAGAPRLWTAGSRPFTPGCILVRATGDVHLLTTWDEGVPDDIPHERLYGITFNPMNMVEVLRGVAGAGTAARVGTDSLTPMFAQLLPMAFPTAEFVDGEQAMRRVRRIKSAAEVVEIRTSVALAERCLAAAEAELRPGVTERQLAAAFMKEMACAGVTTPSLQDVAWITPRTAPWARTGRDATIADGDLVALTGGVVRGGYIGECGVTRAVGTTPTDLFARADDLAQRLRDACRPGNPATALLDGYAAVGAEPPPVPIARGLGLGFDLPIVTHVLPDTAAEPLEAGMVLVLTTYVWEPGVGGVLQQEPVHITADGAESLRTNPGDQL